MRKHILIISMAVLLSIETIGSARAQELDWKNDPKMSPLRDKSAFNATCSGCHGMDGGGSEKAPNITSPKVQKLSDAQIADIISNGVPDTGMPAFHTLTAVQVHALVRHLRALQGRSESAALPGDASRGRTIFFGKGECSSCHTISGEGGFLGPDLTDYGTTVPPKSLREGIKNPNRVVPAGYRLAVVTTHDGSRVEGVVRSEDNFSLQLQTRDGGFHFFQKTDVENLDFRDQPLMPRDYGTRLNSAELDDLVNFLANQPSAQRKAQSADKPAHAE